MVKAFFATLRGNDIRFGGFSLFFLGLGAVVAAASVAVFALTGDLGQAAELGDAGGLLRLLIVLSGIVGVQALAAAVSAYVLGRFEGRVGYSFRMNFAKYLLCMPFKKFQEGSSGERLSIFANDIPAATRFFTGGALQLVASAFSLVASFVFMLTLNVTYTLIFFGTFPVLTLLQTVLAKPIQEVSEANMAAYAEFNAVANDSLQNIPTITINNLEDLMERRYLQKYEHIISTFKKLCLTLLPLVLFGMAASFVPVIIVSALAASSVIGGYMQISEYIAFAAAVMMSSSWLAMLSQNLNYLQTCRASVERFNKATSKWETENEGQRIDGSPIAFANVSFAYGQGDGAVLAVDDMSFVIEPGSRVAFVGGSGSGKSTVLKLLMGLYEPKSGTITSENQASFSYVPQDSFMFPESIGRNIACADEPDMARLSQVCKDAGIFDFIESLPNGFDTMLAESADNVSGGQRQRIALARAFYRDAPVILFDEATSALDPVTEAEVLDNFEKMSKNKTVIMVAHRDRAIAGCDVIIEMQDGKIICRGGP